MPVLLKQLSAGDFNEHFVVERLPDIPVECRFTADGVPFGEALVALAAQWSRSAAAEAAAAGRPGLEGAALVGSYAGTLRRPWACADAGPRLGVSRKRAVRHRFGRRGRRRR